jgi:4'-phosphopantetheinyl transferase EntD
MIELILPAGISAAERTEAAGGSLFPAEIYGLGKATRKRVQEFASGRWCARSALKPFGYDTAVILPGPTREPIWPPGIIGSITHCYGYTAAAVGLQKDYWGVGIDAEVNKVLPDGVLEYVSLPKEREWIGHHKSMEQHWDRLLFCAKEAVYKAWFPLTRTWLDFDEVVIEFLPDQQIFTAEICLAKKRFLSSSISQLRGRYVFNKTHILAAVTLTKR